MGFEKEGENAKGVFGRRTVRGTVRRRRGRVGARLRVERIPSRESAGTGKRTVCNQDKICPPGPLIRRFRRRRKYRSRRRCEYRSRLRLEYRFRTRSGRKSRCERKRASPPPRFAGEGAALYCLLFIVFFSLNR